MYQNLTSNGETFDNFFICRLEAYYTRKLKNTKHFENSLIGAIKLQNNFFFQFWLLGAAQAQLEP